ncbi:N-acetylglucosamine repressor [Jeotgalicoccus aerolatus]|uniref:NBD/HSP70 family sugar kinase n=1 Tax=Jeotgalicoccus aerolatus TaxID=709510 RepID=A0ABS4HJV9_9STAP|nr:ROK family transcriptional regulator [Jeotgalicoccus aerolatus]MBP1951205.1 putative NBD/HSP70 family sugar kinase [Jeotgalicoccus aerolatus]GGD99379.1 xylose repressor [Jeotgalicoccus aerolatus]CAD2077639.1 N-acetylglucosamine repressor [Jeotgalicoccus aerolatus]
MNKSIVNQQSIKQFNTNKILKLLTSTEMISRAELAKQTGLNKATVSKITDELLNENLIKDLGYGISSGGRKPKLLKFNPDAKYIVGIKIDGTDIYFTVMNMKLENVFTQRIEINNNDTGIIAELLKESFNHAVKKLGIEIKHIIEVAVAVPATVNIKGMILHAPNIGWKNIDLSEEFKDVFTDIPINTFNEANAGALGALHHITNPENTNLVYVSAGIGIGTGIIISGNLYRGKMGLAGEFGHNVIVENGRQCHCGRKGCWETYASEQAFYDSLERKGLKMEKDIEKVFTELKNNNPIALEAMDELSSYMNIGLENVARAMSPDYIIIGNKLRHFKNYLNIYDEIQGSKVLFIDKESHTTIEGMGFVIARKYLYHDRYNVNN